MARPATLFTGRWADTRLAEAATESAAFCKRLDFEPAQGAFDVVFDKKKRAPST